VLGDFYFPNKVIKLTSGISLFAASPQPLSKGEGLKPINNVISESSPLERAGEAEKMPVTISFHS